MTLGCDPPANDEFCPKDEVSREQMAALMRRLAEAGVVDADTLDGQDASVFALKTDLPTVGGSGCSGVGFLPHNSSVDWSGQTTRTSADAFDVFFLCALDLPHGATITALTASINDESVLLSSSCSMGRMDVGGGGLGLGNGTTEHMASTAKTSGSFGNQVVTTTDIDHAVVNSRRYAYSATCLAGRNEELGINGVVVQYSLP